MSDLGETLRKTLAGINGPFEEAVDCLFEAVETLKRVVSDVTEGKLDLRLNRIEKQEVFSIYQLVCVFGSSSRPIQHYRVDRSGFPIYFGPPFAGFTEKGNLPNPDAVKAHFNEQLADKESPLVSYIAFSLRK